MTAFGRILSRLFAGSLRRERALLAALGAAYLGWLLFGRGADAMANVWLTGLVLLLPASVLVWRTTPTSGAWAQFLRAYADWHLLAASLLLVLAAEHAFHWQITSDGGLYFANLRSVVFDHDLQIRPELAVLDLADRPHAIVPVGPSIVWAPLYLLVAGIDWLLGWSLSGAADVARGLEGPYVRAALVSSWLAAAAGLAAVHWRMRREFGQVPALLASLLVLAATPLLFYLIVEASMPHAASFGAVALALVVGDAWCRRGLPTARQAVAIGCLVGLATLVRPQNGVFGVFPLVAIAAAGAPRAFRRQAASRLAWLAAGVLPFLVVQAVFGWLVFRANPVPYHLAGDGGYLNLASPRWLDVLFSSRHGLLSWTPVVTLALIGTLLSLKRDRVWAASALVVFGAMCWINGSTMDWWGGSAFGGRRFISTLAALAPGLALIVATTLRRPLLVLAPVAGGAICWNYLLIMQLELGLIGKQDAVGFGRMVRQQAELYVRPPYFYPFAFPANAWFAWRQGVPIDRYDLLSPEPFRSSLDVPFDEWGDRFLVDGWRSGDKDEFGPRYFLDGDAGTMVVPLDVAASRRVSLSARARAGRAAAGIGPVVLSVDVNGQRLGQFTLALGADPTTAVFTAATDAQGGPWRTGYNRLVFRKVRPEPTGTRPGAEPAVVLYMVRLGPELQPPTQ